MQYDIKEHTRAPRKKFDWGLLWLRLLDLFVFLCFATLILVAGSAIYDEANHSPAEKRQIRIAAEKEEAEWKRVEEKSYASGKAYSLKYKTTSEECNSIASKADSVIVGDLDSKKWLQGCLVHVTNRSAG